jgi:hypothetical protein
LLCGWASVALSSPLAPNIISKAWQAALLLLPLLD